MSTNIAWKAATGLALTDEAFHPTVLTSWRNKLRASERPQRIFDTVRAVIAETGALANKIHRAIDSEPGGGIREWQRWTLRNP